MRKKTFFLMRVVIIFFIMIVIPYVQNAGGGPASTGISFFMGYYSINDFPAAYLYIITLGIFFGVILTIFIESLLKDLKESEPTKFDLNQ